MHWYQLAVYAIATDSVLCQLRANICQLAIQWYRRWRDGLPESWRVSTAQRTRKQCTVQFIQRITRAHISHHRHAHRHMYTMTETRRELNNVLYRFILHFKLYQTWLIVCSLYGRLSGICATHLKHAARNGNETKNHSTNHHCIFLYLCGRHCWWQSNKRRFKW